MCSVQIYGHRPTGWTERHLRLVPVQYKYLYGTHTYTTTSIQDVYCLNFLYATEFSYRVQSTEYRVQVQAQYVVLTVQVQVLVGHTSSSQSKLTVLVSLSMHTCKLPYWGLREPYRYLQQLSTRTGIYWYCDTTSQTDILYHRYPYCTYSYGVRYLY